MSKDRYPSIFLKPNGGYCSYYSSNIVSQGRSDCLPSKISAKLLIILLAFKNIASLFKTFGSIQFNNLFDTKTERAKTGEYHLGNITWGSLRARRLHLGNITGYSTNIHFAFGE